MFEYIITTMAAAVTRYNAEDFNQIMFEGFNYELSPETIALIQNLADQVGAPEYVRTPQFPKRDRGGYGGDSRGGRGGGRRRNRAQEISDDDWEQIRTFQATEIAKKEGIDASIDLIRKHLNKMSDKTYDSLSAKIFEELCNVASDENPSEEVLAECKKVGDAVFGIASSNLFYSEMYAKLYKELMARFPFMEGIFNSNFESFGAVFKTIEYCSPDEDYDRFCEINKMNEQRRALSAFYVNLMNMEVISTEAIADITREVQSHFTALSKKEDKKPIVDELSEVIYILVTNGAGKLEDEDCWDEIVSHVENISKMKVKDAPSITNKAIFKHMDIMDALE